MTVLLFFAFNIIGLVSSAPAPRDSKEIVLVPSTRYVPVYFNNNNPSSPYPSARGPFDFIGNWIQSSEWFPIEVNIPDTLSSWGSNVGSFATNVGNGFNTFTQNVGSGFNNFAQNFGNGFIRNITQNGLNFNRPSAGVKYVVLMPVQNNVNNKNGVRDAFDRLDADLEHFEFP